MHTCPPPLVALATWLEDVGTVRGRYGHLLLEQKAAIDEALIDALRPYFESAHLDAREYFHRQIAIDLHPDADAPGAHACYPDCLPTTARRGLFGEVIAGLVTEAFQTQFVGGHAWTVPIFLFRNHSDVENYLWDLRYDSARERQVFGRFGSDFIGIALDDDGSVERVIAGEAKWRRTLTPIAVASLLLGDRVRDPETKQMTHNGRGVWFEINRDSPVPKGLRQLQRLLELRDADGFAAAIRSIDAAIASANPQLPRTNLILITGNSAAGREEKMPVIPWEELPDEYTAPHDLQVVELILEDGEDLIDGLYSSLWKGGADAGI
jgi:hypothetical protein